MESVKVFIEVLKKLKNNPEEYNLSQEEFEALSKVLEYAEKKQGEEGFKMSKDMIYFFKTVYDIVKDWI